MGYAKNTEKKDRKKHVTGQYMTRSHAMKKLQVTLQDFRKLCILKGIYPRDPKNKPQGKNKTYYLTKDIAFLMHDPLLDKFRQKKALRKKIRRAKGRQELDTAKRLEQNHPVMKLDHIIKERYPAFTDALRDMDDALCMIHLFARMPQTAKIPSKKTKRCARLCNEFQNFVVRTHCLRKVFVSIKGMYYQARIRGQPITWLVPHHFSSQLNPDIDLRIMLTFLEFYTTLTGFVLYRLYTTLGLHYPPVFDGRLSNAGENLTALVVEPLKPKKAPAKPVKKQKLKEAPAKLDAELQKKLKQAEAEGNGTEKGKEKSADAEERAEDEEEEDEDEEDEAETQELQRISSDIQAGFEDNKYAQLFRGLHFFLGREAPREALEFVIRAFGGNVSWESSIDGITEGHPCITHSVSDRPVLTHRFLNREYVQPQWIFDSVNVCALLPTHEYAPGMQLPPHLSPFVDNEAAGYIPARAEQLNAILGKSAAGTVSVPKPPTAVRDGEAAKEESEEEDTPKAQKNAAAAATSTKVTGKRQRPETPTPAAAATGSAKPGKSRKGKKIPQRPNKRPKTAQQIQQEAEEAEHISAEVQYREELAKEMGSEVAPLPRAPKDLRDDYDPSQYAALVLPNKKKRLWNAIQRRNRAQGRKLHRLEERRKMIDAAAKRAGQGNTK